MLQFFTKSLSFLKWFTALLLIGVFSLYFILYGSLPDLDGKKVITLLDFPVQIERDEQGIPTIRAKNRADTAFALGYIHAQERFFQMDLLRRSAAGELAGLFGDKVLDKDSQVKIHRFRERAQKIFRHLPKAQYAAVQAYANGVNSGLINLTNEPWEYLLLRQRPDLWEPEDSLLCIYAMYFDLNDELGEREKSLAIMREQLPEQWFEFLTPKGGRWDAPLDTIGEPELKNVELKIPKKALPDSIKKQLTLLTDSDFLSAANFLPGSNSWAIDASLTASSSAMLANDMHLKLRMPNLWYRASWYLNDGRRITGVTLPGAPIMAVGSNEKIAWGFTNSYGNWGDIIALKTNADNTQYLTPEGWQDFSIYHHSTHSNTGKIKEHITIETIWGPVIGKNHNGEMIAHQWIAYSPQAVNLDYLRLEAATSVKEVLEIAPTIGVPPQNLVAADDKGHIAWTIAGAIPRRDARTDTESLQQTGWVGYQKGKDYPLRVDPENHRIWTANNRVVSGDELAIIGFEGGDMGARAQQIRDGLLAKEQFNEADLLAIQLDTRAVFLQRWRQLLIDSIGESNDASMVIMRGVLNKEANLSAQPDSVAYGLVKIFRKIIVNQTIGRIFDVLEKNNPQYFKRSSVDKLIEYPAWELVSKKPANLVPQGYSSWDEYLIAAVGQAYNEMTDNGQLFLQQQTWGKHHKLDMKHALSAALPGLELLLEMPKSPLAGDINMPMVQGTKFGASMRMIVSPGQEAKGIMHMPGGQSSHPLSSYYSRGHQDWLAGKPSSFLPGETKWLLELKSIQ